MLFAAALLAPFAPGVALAHPHIFVDARTTVVFDDNGALSEIRNSWTFDAPFSAWQVQGLDTNNDGMVDDSETQELADDNMQGLSEYGFYTYAGEGDKDLSFTALPGPRIHYDGNQSTLSFAVKPETPYRIGDTLELAVNDPEYYVAITFAGPEAVTLENAPPGCFAKLSPPKEMDPALQDELFALGPDVVALPPELAQAMRGVQGAIEVHCPSGAAAAAGGTSTVAAVDGHATALDAVNALAGNKPAATPALPAETVPPQTAALAAPFGGPPPEPGFVLPKTGFLGWLSEAQKQFYAGLASSLQRMHQDATAFWLLGSLSFLYGVLHAAGPGHGKVVLGAYMLANEAQLRRGIVLSFLSALLQSLVAIGFALVASLALRMTSIAMGEVANWIGILSYALIAVLGFWLIVRRVFGFGHRHAPVRLNVDMKELARAHLGVPAPALAYAAPNPAGHDHDHDHHHGHAHHHDHEHHGHHHHVVGPQAAGGSWRDGLGVVLGVGLRPCSGALVVLAFAISQSLLPAGVAAVLLMGLGTGITVAVMASLAVGAKTLTRRLLGTRGTLAADVLWWLELFGGLVVFGFGASLLLASV